MDKPLKVGTVITHPRWIGNHLKVIQFCPGGEEVPANRFAFPFGTDKDKYVFISCHTDGTEFRSIKPNGKYIGGEVWLADFVHTAMEEGRCSVVCITEVEDSLPN